MPLDDLLLSGTNFAELGMYKKAIEEFNLAIQIKPDSADAYNNLGIVYSKVELYQHSGQTALY